MLKVKVLDVSESLSFGFRPDLAIREWVPLPPAQIFKFETEGACGSRKAGRISSMCGFRNY